MTQLASIQPGALHASALTRIKKSISFFGVVTLDFAIDLAQKEVDVDVSLAGVHIGGGKLNPSNTKLSIGGSAMGYKLQVDFTVDFTKLELCYDATAHLPIVGDHNKKGCFSL